MNKKRQLNKQDAGEVVLVDENESTIEVEKTPEEHIVRPGSQLAALRQSRHLSVEDVSGFLKLAPRQVVAIENDDYASLPGMVITRGFVRSYAKMLEVDPAPFLAALPEAKMPVQDTTPAPNIDARPFEMNWPLRRHSFMPKILVGLVIVAAVGVAGSYYFNKFGGLPAAEKSFEQAELPEQAKSDDSAPVEGASAKSDNLLDKFNSSATTQAAAPVAADNNATPAASTAPVAAPAPAAETTNVPAANNTVPAAASNDVAATPATAAPAPSVESAPAAATAVDPKNALQLSSSHDSWVEVRRQSDDKVLFSKLMRSGDVASVDVSQPVQLVIGNVSGITATLRGNPLSFAGSKNNVARLTLK